MKDREERPSMDEILNALGTALRCQCSDVGVGSKQTRIVGILNVKVLKGLELYIENPYVILKLRNLRDQLIPSMKKTAIRYGYKKRDPYWNEEFTLYVEYPDQPLEIWVEIHEQVGRIKDLIFSNITSGSPQTRKIRLFNVKDGRHGGSYLQGKIMVEIMYIPCSYYTAFEDICPLQKAPTGTPKGGGLLLVIIHEAIDLQSSYHSNPYASLLFRGELRKTVPIKKTSYPKWQEEFTFVLEQPPTEEKLHLEVISTPWMGIIYRKEESMGYIDVKAVDAVKERRIINRYRLQNVKHGSLMVELQWRSI
uniref:synaptotagmin-1-like n=1 Tax=Erigeron canadensis TaxID=72917 RepID=UPI001CB978EC|nr:synaptotagmin-1-like [Erigeron canadensis]